MDDFDLAAEYVPQLIKLDDPPRLEYVTRDCTVIYNPVDGDGRLFYLTDMETRKIVGFQLLLPRGPRRVPPIGERREFPLSEIAPGFTLKECGCTEGFCDGHEDGTCREEANRLPR